MSNQTELVQEIARKVLADFWNDGDYVSQDYHEGFADGIKAVIAAIKKELNK